VSAALKLEYLEALEAKLRTRAANDLNAYCKYIQIPGVPVNDDSDCEEFYPDNVTPAEHHRLINNALMRVDAGAIKRLMVFMPPGSAKSTYGTVTFPTWFMGRHRRKNIICTSYGTTLAEKFGRKCRQITRSREFRDIFNAQLNADNRAAADWSLTNESTYMAGGILSGITGNRADGLVIDDPVKGREDADSVTIRDKTWEAYKTDLRTRLKPGGWIVIIQTRWHEDDLSGRILPETYDGESGWVTARDGEPWYVISIQAECERQDDPLGRTPGEWLWTDWFSPEHWERERKIQGERNWSALYQQRPKPAEGSIIKRKWPRRYLPGEVPPDHYIVHSWDTAIKPNQITNDPSVCTVWAVSRTGYYLLHTYRAWLAYPDLKRKVAEINQAYAADAILIEDKASGQSLIQDLRENTTLPIIAIEPEGDKITRMNAVSGLFESGLVYLPSSAQEHAPPWLRNYESELFGFPLTTHDDQCDSTSQALRHIRNTGRFDFESTGQRRTVASAVLDDNEIDNTYGFGRIRNTTNDTRGF
jgi:predicted phage terminase large subunit-like protein